MSYAGVSQEKGPRRKAEDTKGTTVALTDRFRHFGNPLVKSAKTRPPEMLEEDPEFGAEAEVLRTELRLGQG